VSQIRKFLAEVSNLQHPVQTVLTAGPDVKNSKPAVEEYLPLLLGIVGAVGVFPFAIIRFLNEDYLIALVDTVLVVGLAGLSWFLYKTHNVRVASVSLSLLAISGLLLTSYMKGATQIYWIYPVLVGVFFLIERREALLISVLTIGALTPMMVGNFESFALVSILITISVTSGLAYAFATITRGQRDELMQLATKDPLTGVGNRRALQQKLEEAIGSRIRNDNDCSILMFDLDHFKQVNDIHGHAKGDEILIKITELVGMRIRVTDSIYRIGGEEFVIVAEDLNLDNAARLAEQLRTIVEAHDLAPSSNVTISLGVAQHHFDETAEQWMSRADNALYMAKHSGRNRTRRAA
jgi:diguanylate cyclase (GGDEF)-like protein